jgi:hypothetical protein
VPGLDTRRSSRGRREGRNTRADRRTGRQFIEVDANADGEARQVDAVRIVFDAAPSSMNETNGSSGNGLQDAENEVSHGGRSA